MMVVREGCEVGYVEGDRNSSCSWGGETEARLYCNGAPQGVNISEDCLDIAPTPQVSHTAAHPLTPGLWPCVFPAVYRWYACLPGGASISLKDVCGPRRAPLPGPVDGSDTHCWRWCIALLKV